MSNVNVAIQERIGVAPRIFPSQRVCKRIYQGVLLFADATTLLLAFAAAYWLRFHAGLSLSTDVVPVVNSYVRLAWVLIPIWLALFALLRLYDFQYLLGGTSEYARAINGCTSGMMLVVGASFVDPSFIISRAWLVMAWLISCILICCTRLFLRRLAYTLRGLGYFVTPAVIVGTNSEAMSLAAQLRESMSSGMAIVGFVSEGYTESLDRGANSLNGIPVVGTLESLPEVIARHNVEEVIIATTALTREQRLETALKLTNMPQITMSLSSGLYELFTTGMQVQAKNSVPLMSLNRMRLDPIEMTFKTLLDYTLVLCAAPTLFFIFLVIGILIKLDSPGPIFYRRRVLGIGGKEFDAFKFRTMAINGDEILTKHPEKLAELQATHKLKDDPRVTRMGHLLRRTSLDELPQIINVLLGQMSLVGPRMIHPDEGAMYGQLKSNLLTVKPGLTGLWQVSGRSDISYAERVQIDMQYIRNYNIWLDLQILFFQTLPAVFGKRGAY